MPAFYFEVKFQCNFHVAQAGSFILLLRHRHNPSYVPWRNISSAPSKWKLMEVSGVCSMFTLLFRVLIFRRKKKDTKYVDMDGLIQSQSKTKQCKNK